MKLHPLQRFLYKVGVPLSTLNEFAQENWGYPIPDQDGKFPDWWYIENNLPQYIRDIEVPKEILKKKGGRNRGTISPKTYVRIRHGQVVEIVQNVGGIQSVPEFRDRETHSETVRTQGYSTACHQCHGGINRETSTDDIVNQVLTAIRAGGPGLIRSTSVPTRAANVPNNREDDIMSFIHEETLIPRRRPTITEGMVNPGPLMHDASTVGRVSHPHRSATAPVQRSVPPVRTPVGPSLPSTPRPAPQPAAHQHQRTDTTFTDNTILAYYTDSAIPPETRDRMSYDWRPRNRDSRISLDSRPETRDSEMTFASRDGRRRTSLYRSQYERDFRPMEEVEEDVISEWSGYDDGDANWEDEEDLGRSNDYRRIATERLRAYRRER